MTDYSFQYHCDKLIKEVNEHPHKEELLQLMEEQLLEDTLEQPCMVIG